jgi:hypothetical protein
MGSVQFRSQVRLNEENLENHKTLQTSTMLGNNESLQGNVADLNPNPNP